MGQVESSEERVQKPKVIKAKDAKIYAPLIINKERKGDKVFEFLQNTIDLCKDFTNVELTEALGKEGSSLSAQVIGNLNDRRLFIKVFTQSGIDTTKDEDDPIGYNNLLVEAAIYSCVVPRLIEKHTPFLIKPIAYQECDGLIGRLRKELDFEFDLRMKDELIYLLSRLESIDGVNDDNEDKVNEKIRNKLYSSSNRAYLLTLEQINTQTTTQYKNWIMKQRDLQSYQSAWFQLVWTLLCFERINFRHNDLHWENIYVEELAEPRTMFFELKTLNQSFYFKLPVRYKLLIYDYDRSTIPGLINNTVLVRLSEYGFGSDLKNYGYDATRITCFTKTGVQDVEKEDPKYSASPLLGFLKNFEKVNGKPIPPKENESFCRYPQKSDLKEKGLDKDFMFEGEELKYDFDYVQILTSDVFFRDFKIEMLPTNEMVYTLPTQETIDSITACIKEQFPQILYVPPKTIINQ